MSLGETGHCWKGPGTAGRDRALLGGTRYCREGLGRSRNQPSTAGVAPRGRRGAAQGSREGEKVEPN